MSGSGWGPGAPRILGIVNITPDSFSDGGLYLDPERAIAHGRALRAAGADVIDLGPASSNPDAQPVSAAEEEKRLGPVLAALAGEGLSLSVDSFLTETQRYALGRGVAYLNDIQGFADEAFYPELASASCRLIVMHSVQERGGADRRRPPPGSMLERVCRFFDERLSKLTAAGVNEARLILDPGMGFFLGSRREASLEVLAGLGRLRERFGLPVLISVSRKSFLRVIAGREPGQAGFATLAAELFAANSGVDYIRTHDPGALRDGLRVWRALSS